MTVSEILHEFEWRRPPGKNDYAGGMTAGDIETIKAESDALRRKLKAKRNGTSTPES